MSTHNAVFIIGGLIDRQMETTKIARYQNGWKHVNDLKTKKVGPNAILFNGKVMVVGGHDDSQGYYDP